MEYKFKDIEKKWQEYWNTNQTFLTQEDFKKPKYYVLDMFPYPSGSGLHVGHPLGYIASDIVARYKILKGYNVLHPMGFDSFGLPAEQYAIQTGQHPAVTTKKNIDTFKKQLEKIGFCYDWTREVQTSEAAYYKWTQWIFIQIFNSWFDRKSQKAKPIKQLIAHFEQHGSADAEWFLESINNFSAEEWKQKNQLQQSQILMKYRLVFQEESMVNWCETLGTVLANDEVVNGVSERGGYPVERKKMTQWFMRITEFADRLIDGLDDVEFSDSMKEMQKNWIGKSYGAEMIFDLIKDDKPILQKLEVYTTRPDTVFGIDFMVIAPEHSLVEVLTTSHQKNIVEDYLIYVKSRSDVERMAEVKKITGCFTGSYAIHPFTKKHIPIWVGEYVLINYGKGAVIAVPCGDDRDFAFAKHFQLPITNIWGELFDDKTAYTEKFGQLKNSDFLNNIEAKEAIEMVIEKLETMKIGSRKINYKMRDAGFSRQRYWGEPFPIIYKNNIATTLQDQDLPLLLPIMEDFKNSKDPGKGPLANLSEWINLKDSSYRESDTMPGYAGAAWYFLRYMDSKNEKEFCDKIKSSYWNQVDLYVGGTEHAVGHLLYSRFWTKILFDLGFIDFQEPFKKLLNQGKITAVSKFIYRLRGENKYVSNGLKNNYQTDEIHVDINLVDDNVLDIDQLKKQVNFKDAEFILENGKYFCGSMVEKMSKSKYNTINPDDVINKYGADTFRLYEMFLGPIRQSKPWDTKGIEGTQRFLKKLWRLFFDEHSGKNLLTNEKPTIQEEKILHTLIKKIEDDLDKLNFNSTISAFMIAINSLNDLGCHKKTILQDFTILLAPYAPHIAEELWQICGNEESVFKTKFPVLNPEFLLEEEKKYPIAINGKVKLEVFFNLTATQTDIEQAVENNQEIVKILAGKKIKKIIYAPGRMINIVVE